MSNAKYVDANAYVCTRCQMVVDVHAAPVRQRRSIWFSRRGGIGVGGGGSWTPGRYVCSLCGSGSLVPAGTPRGQTILSKLGITVTGRLGSGSRSLGCLSIIGAALLIGIFCSYCGGGNSPRTSSAPPRSAVAAPPADAQIAAAQAALAAKARAADAASEKTPAQHALELNQAAAAQGDSYGLMRMGERYRDGDLVEKDVVKARDYLQRAAAAGSITAQDDLKRLDDH